MAGAVVPHDVPADASQSHSTAEARSETHADAVDVLRGPGKPLDATTRTFMESRFGFDFGRVRVHADTRAASAASALGALAYTGGPHIAFAANEYAPGTSAGRTLLAHELAHVVQDEGGRTAPVLHRHERRPRTAPVGADAQRIIDLAQDPSRPVERRAVAVVRAIIDQYHSADASKISRIEFREDLSGLDVTASGQGTSTTGVLRVGRNFVEQTTQANFARRVAQVRHEIEHVEQQRAGMTGASRQDEREFIAFYHEALFQEPTGTGRMQHGTRVNLIDGALGYYYCLGADLQRDNTSRRDELVTRRAQEVRRSGHTDLGEAPTSCRRQGH
jgi:hypothetical protein